MRAWRIFADNRVVGGDSGIGLAGCLSVCLDEEEIDARARKICAKDDILDDVLWCSGGGEWCGVENGREMPPK